MRAKLNEIVRDVVRTQNRFAPARAAALFEGDKRKAGQLAAFTRRNPGGKAGGDLCGSREAVK